MKIYRYLALCAAIFSLIHLANLLYTGVSPGGHPTKAWLRAIFMFAAGLLLICGRKKLPAYSNVQRSCILAGFAGIMLGISRLTALSTSLWGVTFIVTLVGDLLFIIAGAQGWKSLDLRKEKESTMEKPGV